MGDRKIINRYIPWDFDPLKIQKVKRGGNKLAVVRNMLPMSVSCAVCGEFMYKGTKFNTKMERLDENYMGIQIIRFYFKCVACNNIFAVKTDPRNADYFVEFGANTNFEPWREARTLEEKEVEAKAEAERDVMKALEDRTVRSRIDMEVHDALDDIKLRNARRDHGRDNVLENYLEALEKQTELSEEEKQRISTLFAEGVEQKSTALALEDAAAWAAAEARVWEEVKEGEEEEEDAPPEVHIVAPPAPEPIVPVIVVKKKKKAREESFAAQEPKKKHKKDSGDKAKPSLVSY